MYVPLPVLPTCRDRDGGELSGRLFSQPSPVTVTFRREETGRVGRLIPFFLDGTKDK